LKNSSPGAIDAASSYWSGQAEIDRVMAAGMSFGCVLADAGYGIGRAVVVAVMFMPGCGRIPSYLQARDLALSREQSPEFYPE
jgi:hypothetical protein